jgi:hypothetical protein
MTDIFEDKILHQKFTEKAEKATNLELKIAFCESFLNKYNPKPKTDIRDMFKDIYPSTAGLVVHEETDKYRGRNIGSAARVYSTSMSVPELYYQTGQSRFELETQSRVDLSKELTLRLLRADIITFESYRNVENHSINITGKIGVFKV